ncbi:Outer membrane protein assembly factor BamC [Candidatus Methylobacter favarea]|uniref:Outer membrane protein assembly factor BamC n=2 Tax=Candidatus Methylobacter favarea TaxID=2707345 RepID=A0A8S0X1Q4_9GAMM|nr:Outer membrane protein assembly factor BamC [Candidatus Methylobacter favarea]
MFIFALVNLSACTYIKNLFPDKEKDYQYTTEIAPLNLPPDLKGNSFLGAPTDDSPNSGVETSSTTDSAPVDTPENTAEARPELIKVELVNSEAGADQLRIEAPLAQAWRIVGKALSRNSIEVTRRDQEESLYQVQYDPDEKKVEDGSLWDEVVFIFTGFQGNEKEYVLKLVENNPYSNVIVLDEDRKPVSEGPGLKLLTLLLDTIKADQANK